MTPIHSGKLDVLFIMATVCGRHLVKIHSSFVTNHTKVLYGVSTAPSLICLEEDQCTASIIDRSMSCRRYLPGAMVHTRTPFLARSRAIGKVIPTMAPLLAE